MAGLREMTEERIEKADADEGVFGTLEGT